MKYNTHPKLPEPIPSKNPRSGKKIYVCVKCGGTITRFETGLKLNLCGKCGLAHEIK